MAKLSDWVEVKKIKVKGNKPDWYVNAEIKIKYFPLGLFINLITKCMIKSYGWRLWLYPTGIRFCLDKIKIAPDFL